MTASEPTPPERQARSAKLYDREILPAYAARFATLLLRQVQVRSAASVIELGCATGALTRELVRRFDGLSHVTALDESADFVAEARTKVEAESPPRAQVGLIAQPGVPLLVPIGAGAADLVVSNLAIATCPEPAAAVQEAVRLLRPGGRLALTAPLRGTWAEFIDLFRDVLVDAGKQDGVAAVDRYVGGLPDGDAAAGWLEQAGLSDVQVTVARWEILFRSAREFFFAPLVAHGPLPDWKQLSGGGDEMQDVFFFTKEAIDTYFKDRPFAVTIVGAAISGIK